MPRLRVVRCAWETTAMKWFEKNPVEGGKGWYNQSGVTRMFMILCNVRFFWFAFVWEVLIVGVLGKANFQKKKLGGVQLFFYWKKQLQFLFFRHVHGAGWRVQVTWSYREPRRISWLPGLGFDWYTPENEQLELKHGGLVQMIFPFKGMIFMFHYMFSGEYKESYCTGQFNMWIILSES